MLIIGWSFYSYYSTEGGRKEGKQGDGNWEREREVKKGRTKRRALSIAYLVLECGGEKRLFYPLKTVTKVCQQYELKEKWTLVPLSRKYIPITQLSIKIL